MWGMYSGVKVNEKHDGSNKNDLGSSGDPLLTPYRPHYRPKILFWDMGMWGMYCGVKANEKDNGGNA